MDRRDLKEGQEVYVKGRVIHTGDHLDIVLDKGSFIENAIILHHEKPVVPQFVAEHIEYHKNMNSPMGDIFNRHFIDDKRVEVWLREALNAYDNLGKAWLFGYEVEKEPIYVIKSKNTTNKYGKQQRLCHSSKKGNYFWCGEFSKFKHKFTHEELEQAGFGWVFDCEGVEVQEMEE